MCGRCWCACALCCLCPPRVDVRCAITDPEAAKRKAEQQTRALYDILSCVRDVRKRSDRTDAMFDPLKEATALLQQFGIQLGDGVLKQLENAELRCACATGCG